MDKKQQIGNVIIPLSVIALIISLFVPLANYSSEVFSYNNAFENVAASIRMLKYFPGYVQLEFLIVLVFGIILIVGYLVKIDYIKLAATMLAAVVSIVVAVERTAEFGSSTGYSFGFRFHWYFPLVIMGIYWALLSFSVGGRSRIPGIISIVLPSLNYYLMINDATCTYESYEYSLLKIVLYTVLAVVVTIFYYKTEKRIPCQSTSHIETERPVDKLLKLKALLDRGAITQEEFDAKKKEILGL